MTPSARHVATGLLDTSVVIDLPKISPHQLPEFPTISAITLAELSVGPQVSTDEQTRLDRQLVLQQAEASFHPLPFDDACARRFGIVASALRRSGRTSRARAFDALIAATAIAHDLPLYTKNANDFEAIPDLDIRRID
jgi:tRNA(fMet)-specific endonuclease VapC